MAESLARLITVVHRCRDTLRSRLVRVAWPCLDSSLACLAAPEPGCARSLAVTAAWLLQPQVQPFTYLLPNSVAPLHPQVTDLLQSCPGVTRSSALLLALKGSVLSLALGPRTPSGEVVRPVVQYLLAAWREEEQEREERKVQEEAMYRTRTLPGEVEESKQERKDYAMLFPSFSELFADLVQEEQFEGKEEKEQEQEVPKDSAPIHEACSLLRCLLLHAAPSEQRCREVQEEREQQFLASYRLVSSLLQTNSISQVR